MVTVAITGIGGFIGRSLADRFLTDRQRRWTVCGIDRLPPKCDDRVLSRCSIQIGDVCDFDLLVRVFQGADIVIHTAALVAEDGTPADFHRSNVVGAETAARAAAFTGVSKFIHFSSVMVYGFNYPFLVSEDGPFDGSGSPYCSTKIESEPEVLKWHSSDPKKGESTCVVIVRPGDVYGPSSVPWIRRPLELMQRGLFCLPDGGGGCINHLHISNLCDAIELIVSGDNAIIGGQSFNLSDGEHNSWKTFYEILFAKMGLSTSIRCLPAWFLKPAITAYVKICSLIGRTPRIRPPVIDFLNRKHPVSIDRARRVLGYQPRVSLHEGLQLVADELLNRH